MAYMSQENKASKAPRIRALLKRYGMKGSVAVDNHSTLIVNIKSGKLDMIGNLNEKCGNDFYQVSHGFKPLTDYISVNPYHYRNDFTGKPLKFLVELFAIMNEGNWDKSDYMTDYFNVGWYVDVNIGRWDKPYVLTK